MSPANPWAERLAECTNLESIRSRATLTPAPLRNLDRLTTWDAIARLNEAFDNHYHVSENAARLIAAILRCASTGISARYPSRKAFITRLYAGSLPPSPIEPICITGLAGVGKSELLRALVRVLPTDELLPVDEHHSPFPMQAVWQLQLSATASIKPMLAQVASQAGEPQSVGKNTAGMQQLLQHIAYRNGLALIAADEFQFVSQGSNANTLVTRMLLSLRALSVPLLYAANYSLIHRLKQRNQEDRHRLLSCVLHLDRDDSNSSDWRALIAGYARIAPEVLQIDPQEDAAVLWRLTGGLPRLLRKLIVIAYERSRYEGLHVVNVGTCEKAYLSNEFAALREDVEHLTRQAITGRPIAGRHDLEPPYRSYVSALPNAAAELKEDEAQQNAYAAQVDSLTVAERAVLREKRVIGNPKKSTGMPKVADDLLEGLDIFKQSVR